MSGWFHFILITTMIILRSFYVTSVMSSEDYGLKQYYAQQGIDSGGDTEITSNSNKDQLANYSIKDNSLLVTYDREKYISVPVSYSYLLYEPNSSTTLKEGSYMITTEKTAFCVWRKDS